MKGNEFLGSVLAADLLWAPSEPGPAALASVLLTNTQVVRRSQCCHQGTQLPAGSPSPPFSSSLLAAGDHSPNWGFQWILQGPSQGDLHFSDSPPPTHPKDGA